MLSYVITAIDGSIYEQSLICNDCGSNNCSKSILKRVFFTFLCSYKI